MSLKIKFWQSLTYLVQVISTQVKNLFNYYKFILSDFLLPRRDFCHGHSLRNLRKKSLFLRHSKLPLSHDTQMERRFVWNKTKTTLFGSGLHIHLFLVLDIILPLDSKTPFQNPFWAIPGLVNISICKIKSFWVKAIV